MINKSDQDLLCEYAAHGTEAAFAELVRRHVNAVYSTATRLVADRHLAQDVTQSVFVALAQSAWKLTSRTLISSWLHLATRNLAAKTVRTEVRRRARDHDAAMTQNQLPATPSEWERVAPHLDAALAALQETDRDAILLRFFEDKSAHEIGLQLRLSDEAAQKRVTRALERLRQMFAARGIALSAVALGGAISAGAVQAAPAEFARLLTAKVLASAAATSLPAPLASALKLMFRLKSKSVAATVTAAACLSLGAGGFSAGRIAAGRHQAALEWQRMLLGEPAPEIPKQNAATGAGVPALPEAPAPAFIAQAQPTVADVLANAAAHFRATRNDPDAWAKGFVVLQQLRAGDIGEALRELELYRGERQVFELMAPQLMGLWARTDPKAALQFALAELPDNSLGVGCELIARSWATHDPAAAWAWFRATTDANARPIREDTWGWLPKYIFAEWVSRDAVGALRQWATLNPADQHAAAFGIADAATEPAARPAILAAIAAVADEGQKRRLASGVAAAWARLDPEGAARWAQGVSFANPAARMELLSEVAEEWWPVDPHATARWVLANAPAEFRHVPTRFSRTQRGRRKGKPPCIACADLGNRSFG